MGPGIARGWEFSDGHKTLTLHLPQGLKWSDGHPFTADDILFWWERIAQEGNLTAGIPRFWKPDGVPMEVARIDSYTVALKFAQPYPLAARYLAFKGNQWPLVFERVGFYAPKHYLEQYLPGEDADDMASYALFEEKASDYNPERPVVSAWRLVSWDPGILGRTRRARLVQPRRPQTLRGSR